MYQNSIVFSTSGGDGGFGSSVQQQQQQNQSQQQHSHQRHHNWTVNRLYQGESAGGSSSSLNNPRRSSSDLLLSIDQRSKYSLVNNSENGISSSNLSNGMSSSSKNGNNNKFAAGMTTSNDACTNVEAHVDRVVQKFGTYSEKYDGSTTSVINHLVTLQQELLHDAEPNSDLSPAGVLMWEKAIKKLRDLLEKMGADHREMHGGVSKCGREIDRNFETSFNGLCPRETQQYETNDADRKLVNQLIAHHLLSNGHLDVADHFETEAGGVDLAEANKAIFVEMQSILDSLNRRDLEPALNWAKANRDRLLELNSSLEFSLHRLKFIELLKLGVKNQLEAVMYARNFEPFAGKHTEEIQSLMGAFLYVPSGLENSPRYASLLDPAQWAQIADQFTKDSRALLGMSVNSPLSVLLNSGTKAVPALLNIREVMQQRNVMGVWGHNDELPIEIDLGLENRYHSIFSCPILRQQTSDHNPPMRLCCGHVISKEALQKLANNNKLKCPYCPVESTIGEAKQIFF